MILFKSNKFIVRLIFHLADDSMEQATNLANLDANQATSIHFDGDNVDKEEVGESTSQSKSLVKPQPKQEKKMKTKAKAYKPYSRPKNGMLRCCQ